VAVMLALTAAASTLIAAVRFFAKASPRTYMVRLADNPDL
jgi:hypothetical protein